MPPKPKNKHLEHARHNEDACNYINKPGAFPDWTVITAFYSALHYVSHKVFPLQVTLSDGSKIYTSTVEEYANLSGITDRSAHSVLKGLTYDHCGKDIGHKYRRLFEQCKTARYSDHNVGDAIAKDALNSLSDIRRYCSHEKKTK